MFLCVVGEQQLQSSGSDVFSAVASSATSIHSRNQQLANVAIDMLITAMSAQDHHHIASLDAETNNGVLCASGDIDNCAPSSPANRISVNGAADSMAFASDTDSSSVVGSPEKKVNDHDAIQTDCLADALRVRLSEDTSSVPNSASCPDRF